MNKINMKIWAFILAFAMIFASVSAPVTVFAKSGGGKIQVVTKETDDAGYSTTYKYNKKGLVSKKTEKRSYKESDSDVAETITTTYKYNKKNRVSKETVINSKTETYYEVDKTTEKQIKGNKGTVTTTTKYETNYTYNKKGLATKSVTTQTNTMSGSVTSTSKSRSYRYDYDDDDDYGTFMELKNGKIVAGYNPYDTSKEKPGKAYYFSGDLNTAVGDTVETTSYKDNGNGTYTVTSNDSTTRANYTSVYVGSDKKEYKYKSDIPSGVTILEKKIKVTGNNKNNSKDISESTVSEKTVTTSTYTYDKKKRVKKISSTAVTTKVETDGKSSESGASYYSDGSSSTWNNVYNTVDTNTRTVNDRYTVSFTYDKKGRAKKKVYSNPGLKDTLTVNTHGLPNYEEKRTSTDDEGSTSHTYKVSTPGAGAASQTTVKIANGTRTTTYVYNAYTSKIQDDNEAYDVKHSASTETKTKTGLPEDKPEPVNKSTTFKYDKNGNLASFKYSGTETTYHTLRNETYGNSIYEGWDNDGDPVTAVVSVSHTSSYSGKNENTIKNGTKTLTKTLTMKSSRKNDRSTEPGYSCSRVKYTLKAKSLSEKRKADAQKQQWAIQNGSLNGFVGLSLGY